MKNLSYSGHSVSLKHEVIEKIDIVFQLYRSILDKNTSKCIKRYSMLRYEPLFTESIV